MSTRAENSEVTPNGNSRELRHDSRITFRVPVRATIYPPPGRESETARICHLLTQDLSGSGVSIIYALPLFVGQRVELELPDRCRSVVVCRVASLSDGHYLAGCRFTEEIPSSSALR